MSQSESSTKQAFLYPTEQQVADVALKSFSYSIPDHLLDAYYQLITKALEGAEWVYNNAATDKTVETAANTTMTTGSTATPQTTIDEIYDCSYELIPPPKDHHDELSAWAVRCHLVDPICSLDSSLPLFNRTLVIKDNIPIAGLPMFNGTLHGFVPISSSIVINRCLLAGARIVGRGHTEYCCISINSHTNSSGPIFNPYLSGYSAGGSSSGCAVLVSRNEVDLSIGCDQGGSCRGPASFCGIVGLKPTWGLVPYTGIDSLKWDVDHCGPITLTVQDNALLLSVIAGWDQRDQRASHKVRNMQKIDYVQEMKKGVTGLKIGIVKEGAIGKHIEPDVSAAFNDTVDQLKKLGCIVEEVSIPLHSVGSAIWLGGCVDVLDGFDDPQPTGIMGRAMTNGKIDEAAELVDRSQFLKEVLLKNSDTWSILLRMFSFAAQWLKQTYPSMRQQEYKVMQQQLIDQYNSALQSYDVLIMPTIPVKPPKLPSHLSTAQDFQQASAEEIMKQSMLHVPVMNNTITLDVSHHPALTIPIAFGQVTDNEDPASGEGGEKYLPIGLMLIAGELEEGLLFRVGFALENATNWKENKYRGSQKVI